MNETYHFDAAVIGAGVVGLCVARLLAKRGFETVLLEAATRFGGGISSRNSEVIHAGIYYPPGSLKARLCVEGRHALYEYCRLREVPFRKTGKLIVAANDSELPILEDYEKRAKSNGVHDLKLLSRNEIRKAEPALTQRGGLLSPSTGIIDCHSLMTALLADFESAAGIFVRNSAVINGVAGDGGLLLNIGGEKPCRIASGVVVNSAGLNAQRVARSLEGLAEEHVPPVYYAIGHYYTYSGSVPFQRLIYPVAGSGGLGVHLTLDMGGQARFGPDISWRDAEDYEFDDSRKPLFYEAIRRYWPGVEGGRLTPGYTGIRPKLWGPSIPDQDFMIQDARVHGIPGLINLFGIESPGLTASFAIADHVVHELL